MKSRKSLAASCVIDRTLLKRLIFGQIASRTRVSSRLRISFLYSHYCGLGAIADRRLDWVPGLSTGNLLPAVTVLRIPH